MFINQAMTVIDLFKISGQFNRVYFIKAFKDNICDFFVFKPICAHLCKPARRLAGGSVAEWLLLKYGLL